MRISLHHISITETAALSFLTVTDDLINSRPMTPNTAYAILRKASDMEFQNRQVGSIKGSIIDILQAILEKTYTFASTY